MRLAEITRRADVHGSDWGTFRVPVSALQRIYDPFEDPRWEDITRRITRDDVRVALAQKSLVRQPYDPWNRSGRDNTRYHIRRIAQLVRKPDDTPINIVQTRWGSWTLDDGFHRLAAAIYRGDKFIRIKFDGTADELRMWLGIGQPNHFWF